MPKLTQEEFDVIDERVFNFGQIQNTLSVLIEEDLDDTFEEFIEYDKTYAKFIAYSIIEICNIRVNKDEVYAKIFYKMLKHEDNYSEMIGFLFQKSSPMLRIVFDLGGFDKKEIEKRNAKNFPCFSGIFPDVPIQKVTIDGVETEITKDLIYHKYKEGSIERAIFDDSEEHTIYDLLKKSNKNFSDTITKSPFDNYEEDKLPTYAQFAFHCNSKNAIKLFLPKVFPYPEHGKVLEYAIMSGGEFGIQSLTDLGISWENKFYLAAKYFNRYALNECENLGEGTVVYNNVYSIYAYKDNVHDQLFDPIVYDLIDHPILNDATKWLLVMHGVSMYTGSKYLSYSVNKNNDVITNFIYEQFPSVKSFIIGADFSSDSD